MSDAHTTATPETTNAAPTAHPPVRENQRVVEAEVEQGAMTGQRVMRAVGGGSPETPPEQFAGALTGMDSRSQSGMLRQLQQSYGNSYVGAVIQRKADGNGACTDCEKKEKEIQRKGEGSVDSVPDGFEATMQRSGTGHPLDDGTRSFMESRFGQDFGDVQVHTDSDAAEASQQIQAQAFTTGRDIYFGRGRFQPQATEGKKLLAHELTHVVQQNGITTAQGMAKPILGSSGDAFEKEADAIADRIVNHDALTPSITGIAPPRVARQPQPDKASTTGTVPTTGSPTTQPLLDPKVPEPFEGASKLAGRSTALEGEITISETKLGVAFTKQDLPWKDLIDLKLKVSTLKREKFLVDTYFVNAFLGTQKLDEPAEEIIKKCHNAAPDEEQTLHLLEGLPAPPGTVSPIVSDLLLQQPELFPAHVVGLYRAAVEEFQSKSTEEAKRAAALLTPIVSRPIPEIIPDFAWMIEHEDVLEQLSIQVGFITTLNQEAPVLLEKKEQNSTTLGIDDIRLKVNEERTNFGTMINPVLGKQLGYLYPVLEAYYFFAFYDGMAKQMDLFRIAVETGYERLNQPFSSPDVIKDLERAYSSQISVSAGSGGLTSVSQLAPDQMRAGYRWITKQFENVLDPWVTGLSWVIRIWEGFGLYDTVGEMGQALKALISVQTILMLVGFIAFMIAIQFVPYGNLIADALMYALLGKDVLEGLVILGIYFDSASDAITFRELYAASQKLKGGGTVLISLLLQLALLAGSKALGAYLKYRRGLKIKDITEIADDPAIRDGPPSVQQALAEAQKGSEGFSKWKDTLRPEEQAVLDDPANAALKKTWAEMDPVVRRVLTRCGSPCIPRNATPQQAGQIKAVLDKFGINGGDIEALLKEYFHARRDVLQGAIDEVGKVQDLEALEAIARENPVVPPGTSPALVARINSFFGKFKLLPDEVAMLREYLQVRSNTLETALADIEKISAKSKLLSELRKAAEAAAPAVSGTPQIPKGKNIYDHAVDEHGSQLTSDHLMNRAKNKIVQSTKLRGLQQGQWYNNQLIVEADQRFPGIGIGDGVDVNFGRPVGRVYLPDGLVISDVTWVRMIRNADGSFKNAFPVLPPGVTY